MDFDKREGAGMCSALKMDMSFGHEGGGDFTLPDYMPEIQKLLYVVPSVLPETKFLSGNVLETGGTLTYSVLYLGDDGKLSCSSLVSEYSADTALPLSVENAGEIFTDCEMENTVCRVTGPRTLNIKTRLRSRVMCDEHVCDEKNVVDSEEKAAGHEFCSTVERLTGEVSSVMRCHGMTTGSVSGDMSVPDGERPVLCQGSLRVTAAETAADGVFVKGDVYVKCIFTDPKGENICRKTKLPFEITVPVRDVSIPGYARAWGRVASVTVSSSDSSGQYSVGVEYDMEAETLSKTQATLCHDAYSTDWDSVCDTRECDFLDVLCFGSGQLSVSGESEVKGSIENCQIIDFEGYATSPQVVCADGKLFATGTVKVKALCGDGSDLFVGESDIPFRYELPTVRTPEGAELQSRVSCGVLACSGKQIGGKISVICELSFSYEVMEKKRKRFVTTVHLGAQKPAGAVGTAVKVYYPTCEESLWNVCKRYHASGSRIVSINGISGDFVPAGKPVIIF